MRDTDEYQEASVCAGALGVRGKERQMLLGGEEAGVSNGKRQEEISWIFQHLSKLKH